MEPRGAKARCRRDVREPEFGELRKARLPREPMESGVHRRTIVSAGGHPGCQGFVPGGTGSYLPARRQQKVRLRVCRLPAGGSIEVRRPALKRSSRRSRKERPGHKEK